MTNLKDLLKDLVMEAMQFGAENSTVYNETLGEEKKEELVDEYLEVIKDRLIG